MKLNNRAYDILKWVALIALDAIGVCYRTVAMIWGLPYGEEVSATCMAISLCLGALLGVSTAQYYKDKDKDAEDNYVATMTELNHLREELYSDEEEETNDEVKAE